MKYAKGTNAKLSGHMLLSVTQTDNWYKPQLFL